MPNFSTHDRIYMSRALELAKKGLFSTKPNPRVGCVITQTTLEGDIEVVGEGWHRKAGEAHAEINALMQAGEKAAGSTAYVTLEPCSHHGKTGPCADALVKAGVERVVIAMLDPNPLVAGNGVVKLQQAGIKVDVGLFEDQAVELNKGFVSRMTRNRPYVIVKLAMSIDGRTAMDSGESKWITGVSARQDVQRLRARSSAVISGRETISFDNASLRVRFDELGLDDDHPLMECVGEWVQPHRVVLDSSASLSGEEAVFGSPGHVIYVSGIGTKLRPELSEVLEASDGDHLSVALDDQGSLDLKALLIELSQRECNEVLVEAGATLAGGFVSLGLCDELWVYVAPKLMGSSARPLLRLPFDTMSEAISLDLIDQKMLGDDMRLCYRLNAPSALSD